MLIAAARAPRCLRPRAFALLRGTMRCIGSAREHGECAVLRLYPCQWRRWESNPRFSSIVPSRSAVRALVRDPAPATAPLPRAKRSSRTWQSGRLSFVRRDRLRGSGSDARSALQSASAPGGGPVPRDTGHHPRPSSAYWFSSGTSPTTACCCRTRTFWDSCWSPAPRACRQAQLQSSLWPRSSRPLCSSR